MEPFFDQIRVSTKKKKLLSSAAISPFWLYVLLFVWVYLQQISHMWYTAILRYGGQPPFVTASMMAMFSVPLAGWAWLSLPSDLFSIVPSTSIWTASILIPTFAIAFGWAIAALIDAALLAQKTTSVVGSRMGAVGTAWILYLSDWLDGRAYITITVWMGLSTVSIAVYAFLAFANELSISVKPTFKKNLNRTFCGILAAGFPDFVVMRCNWKHITGSIIAVFCVILIFQQASNDASDVPVNGNVTGPLGPNMAPVAPVRHFNPNTPPDPRMHYLASDQYYEWDGRPEDEEEEIDSLAQLYFKKRDSDRQHKSTAVCLAGHVRDGYANDMQWLHALYKSIGSYDLFVWLSPSSLPFNTGMLKPRQTSLARSPGGPGGMYRRYNKYHRDHMEDWAFHMWGWSHCVDLIKKHSERTGTTYDFLLLSIPNATFTDFSIPKQDTWDPKAVSFMPTNLILETAMFGPYDKVAAYAPLMHSTIMAWTGTKAPRDYNRGLAKARGYDIKEY